MEKVSDHLFARVSLHPGALYCPQRPEIRPNDSPSLTVKLEQLWEGSQRTKANAPRK